MVLQNDDEKLSFGPESPHDGVSKNWPSPRAVFEDISSCSNESEPTSSCKASSTSDSEPHPNTKRDVLWPSIIRTLVSSTRKFQTLPPLGVPKFRRNRKNKSLGESMTMIGGEFHHFRHNWKNFSLLDLKIITDNFSSENLIGEGGYARVYKGILENGQHVAIKCFTREDMTADFLSELGIIAHVDHPNTAKLVGYGVEGGMHLVFHLSPHGSLASLLSGGKDKLDWKIRYKIAIGCAEGLVYLHEGGQRRIIHRDIKASNVLLTEDFDPQISDFGLAKWLPDQCTDLTVEKFEGTIGYLPPEFLTHGIVDEKTDVFSYGVLLLELITGRQALDESQKSLVVWAKPLIEKNLISELVDPSLVDDYDPDQLNRLALTASLCISQSAHQRPQMNQVVRHLRGEKGSLDIAIQTQKTSGHRRAYSEEFIEAGEYQNNCLNDAGEQRIGTELCTDHSEAMLSLQ